MRLIDADWLLNAIEKLKVRNTSNTATIFDVLGVLDDVEKIIKAAPINAPVKHGHWINIDAKFENMYVAHQCSICKSEFLGDASNFCPRCGAKMEGEQNVSD